MAKGSVKDLEASLKGYLQGFIPPKQDLGMDGLGALHRHLDELKRVNSAICSSSCKNTPSERHLFLQNIILFCKLSLL